MATESKNQQRHALWKISHNFSAWVGLYGLGGAIAIVTLGKRSIWKVQVEVLDTRYDLRSPSDSNGEHGNSSSGGDSGGGNGSRSLYGFDDDDDYDDGFCDQAALAFKDIVQAESNRISFSGTIIGAITIAALVLPQLSRTHWLARAFWISSLMAALLAVYHAGNLVWKVGCLLSGRQVRAWIRGSDKNILDVLFGNGNKDSILRLLTPTLSAVITISAPRVLLSAAILFLLPGFGIYLGCVWTRALDADAGYEASRNVFIVYLVLLMICYFAYTLWDILQDYGTDATVRGAILRNLEQLPKQLPRFLERKRQESIQEQIREGEQRVNQRVREEKHEMRKREREMREIIMFDICDRIFGKCHFATLESVENLIRIWIEQGKVTAAENL